MHRKKESIWSLTLIISSVIRYLCYNRQISFCFGDALFTYSDLIWMICIVFFFPWWATTSCRPINRRRFSFGATYGIVARPDESHYRFCVCVVGWWASEWFVAFMVAETHVQRKKINNLNVKKRSVREIKSLNMEKDLKKKHGAALHHHCSFPKKANISLYI